MKNEAEEYVSSWGDNVVNYSEQSDICFEQLAWLGPSVYNQRRIVSAANKYNLNNGQEITLPCVRHSSKDLHQTLEVLKGACLLDKGFCAPRNQGFIDQYGNWWSREDAFVIAKAANQINFARNGSNVELYSEGLY